jgi:hypothetical protein
MKRLSCLHTDRRFRRLKFLLALGLFSATVFPFAIAFGQMSKHRYITIHARQYAYDPPIIRANIGDTLHIKLVSKDVTHGFYLEGHDIDAEIEPENPVFRVRNPSQGYNWRSVSEIVVNVQKSGKFRYPLFPHLRFPSSFHARRTCGQSQLPLLGRRPFGYRRRILAALASNPCG